MQIIRSFWVLALAATLSVGVAFAADNMSQTTSRFQGPKANTGTATFSIESGKKMLKVSDDFKVPDTPAPTWRVVDSKGQIHTLEAFKIQSLRGENRQIVVPSFVQDIAVVQVYCA